ncbi:MAG: hypothetical protein ACOYBS_11225 [Flavobacterium sp.]
MKKIISLTFVISLFILSCSSSGSQDSNETPLLCNKKVIKATNGSLISETNFGYNGNKIVNAITNQNNFIGEKKFYYTGDLITKVESYSNNTLYSTEYLTYNSQQNPSQIIFLDHTNNTGTKFVYNYNSDVLITVNEYSGDLTSQNQIYSNSTITFTKTNGEITSFHILSTNTVGGTSYTKTNNYTYDSKNNYMKNVLGYDKLSLFTGAYEWESYNHEYNYCTQNVTQLLTSNNSSSNNQRNIVTLYTYNSNNYPILETQTIYSGGITSPSGTRNSWYYYN